MDEPDTPCIKSVATILLPIPGSSARALAACHHQQPELRPPPTISLFVTPPARPTHFGAPPGGEETSLPWPRLLSYLFARVFCSPEFHHLSTLIGRRHPPSIISPPPTRTRWITLPSSPGGAHPCNFLFASVPSRQISSNVSQPQRIAPLIAAVDDDLGHPDPSWAIGCSGSDYQYLVGEVNLAGHRLF